MIRVVVDMNLSPVWASRLANGGWEAVHWSTVGANNAPDRVVMEWAAENGYVVLTHDLDFPALLAATQAKGPSVIVLRAADVLADQLMVSVQAVLGGLEAELAAGAIVSIDEGRARVRLLPL